VVTGSGSVTAGVRGTNRHVTRDRGCLRATRRLSGASLFRPQHGRAGQRAAIEGAARSARVDRSRVGGSHGCSLTTSRLQRLVTGILCDVGPHRFGEVKTRRTNTNRRPITVTGGKLERAARVLVLRGRLQIR
jgi:hypothetical protein